VERVARQYIDPENVAIFVVGDRAVIEQQVRDRGSRPPHPARGDGRARRGAGVLVAMADGNVVGTHQALGPMTIHLLRGHLRYRVDGEEHALSEGEVLFFGPAAAHDITADADSALLLTLSQEGHAA
jgi:quercetin dioxygenase-like cupin family protein